MSEQNAHGQVRSSELTITVTRADGSVENLGVVSYHHTNPLRRLWFRLTGRTA
jgi:hypothetical protein